MSAGYPETTHLRQIASAPELNLAIIDRTYVVAGSLVGLEPSPNLEPTFLVTSPENAAYYIQAFLDTYQVAPEVPFSLDLVR
jgi:hypothetical protein